MASVCKISTCGFFRRIRNLIKKILFFIFPLFFDKNVSLKFRNRHFLKKFHFQNDQIWFSKFFRKKMKQNFGNFYIFSVLTILLAFWNEFIFENWFKTLEVLYFLVILRYVQNSILTHFLNVFKFFFSKKRLFPNVLLWVFKFRHY